MSDRKASPAAEDDERPAVNDGRPAEDDGRPESVGFRRRREKRERAAAFLAGAPLLVGLDLGKKRHAVWLAGLDLVPIARFTVAHSSEGLATLLEKAERVRESKGFDRVLVFMEPTSHYWQNVANRLEAHGIPYRTVAALAVSRQREIEHLTYAKGDYRDAELIVRLGGSGQWLLRLLDDEPLWIELHALAREHDVLLELETADRLGVRSLLELAIPEFLECFNDPLAQTAQALLGRLCYPPQDAPHTYEALVARAQDVQGHRIRRGKIRTLAARLEAVPSFGFERALGPTLGRLGFVLERFQFVSRQRKRVREQLVAVYETTPYRAVLDTIPGVSPESHALLLGLIGDPKRYDRSTCLVKLAATEPRENHSGSAEGSHSISRRGKPALRHLLYRVALGLLRANSVFAAYVSRLRTREKNPLAWNQALVAAGNKYLRLVHHLCVSGKAYDPSRLMPRA